MSVNAVQQFVADALNNLTSPGFDNVTSRVMPPQIDDIGAPKIYVWGANFTDRQFTMPRGRYDTSLDRIFGSGGTRKRDYNVKIWIVASMAADDPNADTNFALLIENVLLAIIAIRPVQVITDSVTGVSSGLTSIGDRFTVEQSPPHTLADQRLLRLDALVTATIEEMSAA